MSNDDTWWENEHEEYHATTSRLKHSTSERDGPELSSNGHHPPSPFGSTPIPVPRRPPPLPPGFGDGSLRPNPSVNSLPSLNSSDNLDDDSDEDAGRPQGSSWIECKELGSDKSIWYNPTTLQVSPTDPNAAANAPPRTPVVAPVRGAPIVSDEPLADEDISTIRRNSAILAATWDQQDYDQKASLGDGSGNQMKTVRKNSGTANFQKAMASMGTQVDVLIDKTVELADVPHSVKGVLQEIREKINAIQAVLEQEINSQDNRTDVEALVEFNKLRWEFSNEDVVGFRARAAKCSHSRFKNWHSPQYFSSWPVPSSAKIVTCTVRLAFTSDDVMTQTRLNINENDTAIDAMREIFRKYLNRSNKPNTFGAETDYGFKAVGYKEFMEGTNKLFSYEYVRQCLHDGAELELIMVQRPKPVPIPDEMYKAAEEYKNKVDPEAKVLTPMHYQSLSSSKVDWEEMTMIPLSELHLPFRVRICGAESVSQDGLPRYDNSMSSMFVRMVLFHGEEDLSNGVRETRPVPISSSPRWQEWLPGRNNREIMLPHLPRATRVAFLLFGKVYDKSELLGYTVVQLIDHMCRLRSGTMSFRLWPLAGKNKEGDRDLSFIYRATTRDNLVNVQESKAAILTVQFDEFMLPVMSPMVEQKRDMPFPATIPEPPKRLKELVNQDVLCQLSPADKALIWSNRHYLVKDAQALPKVLQSVDWTIQDCRMEVYSLLSQWAKFSNPVLALQLLDARYQDYTVREYAVNCLRDLSDDDLQLCLLQLCQCLKFEPYHDSPLARFLIERSLNNPYQIGHFFFWHLKAELASPDFCERYAVILEEYLAFAGPFAQELRKQANTVLKLQRVAEMIVKLKLQDKNTDAQCMKEYHLELEKLNRDFFAKMGSFQIPLNPKLEATTLIVEKCRYMSSKKIPLWLAFNNADPNSSSPIYIIFKSGDDLRQDILTLQLLRIMDKIWLNEDLDMRLKPYRCLATGVNDDGEGLGMIEVVTNADTTSGIQLKYGGRVMGALSTQTLDDFLREHNKGPMYEKAVDNFVRSCAGYCVATYVMGIGDRHNGNIMVTKDGHLFHIDFGHFLGNFKKKFGIKRERAAFVFTPEMAYVMGGAKYQKNQKFKEFKELSCKAFNALRKHASLLETMFLLMVSAGMPELAAAEDITYIQEKLCLNMDDKQAEKVFKQEVKKSLSALSRRLDNAIHNIKHG